MKKTIAIVLVLICALGLVSCGIKGKPILYIEFYEWKMRAVMSNDAELANNEEALVVAVGEPDELYPNAKIVDMTLTGSNGKITLADNTNNITYEGTYKIVEEISKGIQYEITIDGITGSAFLSPAEHYSGTELPTLPLDMGEYTLYFIPSEAGK